MDRTRRRRGYTILELLVVLAVLILLGAVILPSLTGFDGNTKQRAAADLVRQRLAEARAKAAERGVPFRLAVNTDMTRVRVAQDGDDFAAHPASETPGFDSSVTEDKLDEATAEVQLEEGDERTPDEAGWITVATVRPDGSVKEARHTVVAIRQKNFPPILVQVRGLTGQARTSGPAKTGGQP